MGAKRELVFEENGNRIQTNMTTWKLISENFGKHV